MAQVNLTTSYEQGIDVSNLLTRINNIRTNFVPGSPIRQTDVNEILQIINTWLSHYHNVTDNVYSAYGNTAPYSTIVQSRNSGAVNPTASPLSYTANVNDGITAAKFQQIRNMMSSLKYHYHMIDDVSY